MPKTYKAEIDRDEIIVFEVEYDDIGSKSKTEVKRFSITEELVLDRMEGIESDAEGLRRYFEQTS